MCYCESLYFCEVKVMLFQIDIPTAYACEAQMWSHKSFDYSAAVWNFIPGTWNLKVTWQLLSFPTRCNIYSSGSRNSLLDGMFHYDLSAVTKIIFKEEISVKSMWPQQNREGRLFVKSCACFFTDICWIQGTM